MEIKSTIKATLKLALSIFIALIAISATATVSWIIYEKIQKEEAKKFEVVRNWKLSLQENLQMEMLAKTKVVDGQLLVTVDFVGYPAYLSHPQLKAKNKDARLVITFEDSDGFKLHEKELKISELNTKVDNAGKDMGLSAQYNEYLNLEKYKKFSKVTVGWTLETSIPSPERTAANPALTPKDSKSISSDHCAPGLSKPERLRRLATHGNVRQTGEASFTAGYKEITFYPDSIGGGLLSCR
jgi:hypothetical protein